MKAHLPAGASRYILALSLAIACLTAISFSLASNGVDIYPLDAMFWKIVAQSVGIQSVSQELYTAVTNFRVMNVLRIAYLFFAGVCFAFAAFLLERKESRSNSADAVLLICSLVVVLVRFVTSANGTQSFPIIQSGPILCFTVIIAVPVVVVLTRYRKISLFLSSSVIPIILAVFIARFVLYKESPVFFDLFLGDGLYRAMLFLQDEDFVMHFAVPLGVCLTFLFFARLVISGPLLFSVRTGLATVISVLAIGITGPLWMLGALSVWCTFRIFSAIQGLSVFSHILGCITSGSFVVACDAVAHVSLCWEPPLGASLLFLFGPAIMLSQSGLRRMYKCMAVASGIILFAVVLWPSLRGTDPVEATEVVTSYKLEKRKNFLGRLDAAKPARTEKTVLARSGHVQKYTIASIKTRVSVRGLVNSVLDAVQDGADLVVLPAPSEIMSDEATTKALEELSVVAKESRVAIICGFVTKTGEKVRRITYGFNRNGRMVGYYQKSHKLPNESFELGDKVPVLHIDGIAVGILIGSDIYFSEIEHGLLHRGAKVVIWQLDRPLTGFDGQRYLKRLLKARSQANRPVWYVVSGLNLTKNQGDDIGEDVETRSIRLSKDSPGGNAAVQQTLTATQKKLKEFSYPALYGNKASMLNVGEKAPLHFRIAVLNTLPTVEIMRGIVVAGHRRADIVITSENIYQERKRYPSMIKARPQFARLIRRLANDELLQASRMARRFRVNVFITNGYNQMRTVFLDRSGEVNDVYLKGEKSKYGWVADPGVFLVDGGRFGGHICADSASWEKSMDQFLHGVDLIINPAGGIGNMGSYNLASLNGFGFRVIASPAAPPQTGCLASNHLGEFFFDSRGTPCLGRSPGIFDVDLNPMVMFGGKLMRLRKARRLIFAARRPELYDYR